MTWCFILTLISLRSVSRRSACWSLVAMWAEGILASLVGGEAGWGMGDVSFPRGIAVYQNSGTVFIANEI